jgi:hypothetical protein
VLSLRKPWRILLLVVGVSAALRLRAAESIPTPWIAPDELTYAELGRSFWQTGRFAILGVPTAFYSALYPILAGLPLSLGDRETGYELVKAMNAVVISLTALPVYLWGRELVSRRWALVAAVVTLAAPCLAYAGLIMTEVVFFPTALLAAWAMARAVAVPTLRRQALALGAIVLVCAARMQAFVFLPAYVTAVALEAGLHRDRRRMRAHVPALGGLLLVAVLWSGWQLRHGGPLTKVLGGYQAAGESGYDAGEAARYVLYHLGDLMLISGVVPFCALFVLAWRAVEGREDNPNARAFLATTISLVAWIVVEVGVFASRHVGHLAERNLFPLVPLLLLALVLWLQRGAPRPLVPALTASLVAVALLVGIPLERFTTVAAAPSAFTQIPLYELTDGLNLDTAVPLAAAVLLAVCGFVPRRVLAVGVPALLVVLGVAASVSASRFIASESRNVQKLTLGPEKDWIDASARGPVTYLETGFLNAETPSQSLFWNSKIQAADSYPDRYRGAQVVGLPLRPVGPLEDGRIVDSQHRQVDAPYALASNDLLLAGKPVAQLAQGLVLWKIDQPLRARRWWSGIASGGTVDRKAELQVYACRGGALKGMLTATPARKILVLRNGIPYDRLDAPADVPKAFVVPSIVGKPVGTRLCRITLRSDGPFSLWGTNFA